jgi:putative tributyrin esterase
MYTSLRSRYLLLLTFLVAASTVYAQDAAPKPEPVADESPVEEIDVEVTIQGIDVPGIDRDLRIVDFEALSIGRLTKYMIFLPDGYDAPENAERAYPVLYLLHGFSQNYTVWPMMGVSQYLDTYNDLIVVMPDAGNSWYINWAESEGEELNNWEDFIIYDLVHNVDQTFRTVPAREGRAISGLSMGGYGALILGLRHPDMFCSIASHSGALDYARTARQKIEAGEDPSHSTAPQPLGDPREENVPDLIAIPGFTKQHERYPNGVNFETVEQCDGYDPFFLVENIPVKALPHIYLDCGLQDGLIATNKEFALLLMNEDIPFTWGQSPGEHRPSYWGREVAQSLGVQYAVIQRNLRFLAQRQAAEMQRLMEEAATAEQGDDSGASSEHEDHDGDAAAGDHQHKQRTVIIDPK